MTLCETCFYCEITHLPAYELKSPIHAVYFIKMEKNYWCRKLFKYIRKQVTQCRPPKHQIIRHSTAIKIAYSKVKLSSLQILIFLHEIFLPGELNRLHLHMLIVRNNSLNLLLAQKELLRFQCYI